MKYYDVMDKNEERSIERYSKRNVAMKNYLTKLENWDEPIKE